MTNKISMIELFSGIGAQERALRQLGLPYEVINTCDCDKDATLSYAAMRWDLEKEMETFEFPTQDKMIEELQSKNLGYDFQKGKHSITSRTSLLKLKQYYIADKLSKNLGDISKVERLPYSDLWTYSYPCTDLSVAGKGEGMVIKCDKCEHTWPIDFEHPENNNACPKCGNIDIASTRSGLLGQVQRLLTVSYEEGTLPKYLLLENVKNLVGAKFKPQFEAWIKWLDLIGYNTYWKVINSKHMGIPQNRERVFAISIRKDVDTNGFTFPETIPLTTRLKDMLEKDVPEQYYLPDERIDKILNSTFMKEKMKKCVSVEEEVNPVRIGNIYDENYGTGYAGNVWDQDGISPTLQTAQGGNRMPLVIDEIKVVGNYMPSNHDASRVVDVDGIEPTVKENHGTVTAIAEPQIDIKERFFRQVAETILENQCEPGDIIDAFNKKVNHSGVCPTITTRPEGFKTAILPIVEEQEPFIVASSGRNPQNPSDRTTGTPTEQRFEPNFSGCTNTLTSVQKDNYICEPQVLRAERTEYGKAIRKQYEAGEIDEKIGNMREMKPRTDGVSNTITTVQKDNYVIEPIIYDDYNSRISSDQDAINTLTCNCGASAERNGVKIIEPIVCEERKDEGIRLFKDDCVGTLRTIDACGDKRVIEPQLEFVGGLGDKDWAKDGKQLSRNYPQGSRVYSADGIASALTAQGVGGAGGYSGLYAVEEDIDLKCLNSKGGRNGVEGLQPSLSDRVYDAEGCATACATSTYFMPGYLVSENLRWRIRKLMPVECWKLMAFSSEDHNRAAQYVSNSALYKQAGNSIVVNVLVALMSSLFIEDGYKSKIWTKYALNPNE